jgi:hypothetical protein
MAVEEGGSDGQEVGMARVVDLNDTPGILTSSNLAATDLDVVLGSDNSEGHETSQFGILLHSILVVLLNIVREVVDWNPVVLNVLHDQLLGLGQLSGRQRICSSYNRDNVDTGGQSLHQLDIKLAEATRPVRRLPNMQL